MAYGEYENYFIKEEEVLLLLAGVGVKQWYGFTSGDRRQRTDAVSKEDVYRILGALYRKGYIEWEEESVRLLEPVSSLVEIIRQAHYCIKIESKQEESFIKGCYYANNHVLLLETSKLESRMLKFSLWKEKDFLAYLWGTGIFPEEELILEEDDGEEVSVQEKTRPVSEQRGIVTLYDMKTGIEESKMIVEEEGIFPYVVLRTGLTENRRPYCHKDCEHVLMDWLHREG